MKNLSKIIACLFILSLGTSAHAENVADFEKVKALAESGDVKAQYDLGVIYFRGKGEELAKDYVLAKKWFLKSAEQGSAEAEYYLCYLYNHGDGVEKDHKEALKWCKKAAKQKYLHAFNSLGSMYQQGQGVVKDIPKAIKWYSMGAKLGDSTAQHNLGYIYYKGDGVSQDFYKCYLWSNISSVLGDFLAPEYRDLCAKELTKTDLEKAQKESAEILQKIQTNKK